MEPSESKRLELMRLVDGELPAATAAAVAQACRADPAAGGALAALHAERALLRAAFPPSAVAAPTLAAIDAAFAARRRRQRSWPRFLGAAGMPLAASLLTAAVVGAWAVVEIERRADEATQRVLAAQARDRELVAATMLQALDTQVSGSSVGWSNPDSGNAGSITLLRTFRAADGRWCREFERRIDAPSLVEHRTGIACRGIGGWRLELERPGGEA